MREIGLPFKGHMVRAIFEKRKRQTRRVVKLNSYLKQLKGDLSKAFVDTGRAFANGDYLHVPCPMIHDEVTGEIIHDETVQRLFCPYGDPPIRRKEGSIADIESNEEVVFYVREAHFIGHVNTWDAPKIINPMNAKEACYFREGWDRVKPKWRPSIFMPKWASRIRMLLESVRAERLQDISEKDYFAEGLRMPPVEDCFPDGRRMLDVLGWWKVEFKKYWNEINGKRPGCSWEKNPWVWILEWDPEKVEVRG